MNMSITEPANAPKATGAATRRGKKAVVTTGRIIGAVTMNEAALIHLPSTSMALIV